VSPMALSLAPLRGRGAVRQGPAGQHRRRDRIGPVGLSAVIDARKYGPVKVVAIDLDDWRLKRAEEFGATETPPDPERWLRHSIQIFREPFRWPLRQYQ